jgi:hypothetical protein
VVLALQLARLSLVFRQPVRRPRKCQLVLWILSFCSCPRTFSPLYFVSTIFKGLLFCNKKM